MIEILYQDNDIIVCIKPAGLLSEGESEDSLLTVLAAQCGGQVFPVHRLDRGAAGLMVFARNSKAAAGLSRAVQEKQLKKEYFARVSGAPAEKEGEMTDFLFKDSRKGKVFAVKRPRKGVREARLTYRVLWQDGDSSLVRVALDTGRTHQIRVQFSSRGMPLWGDGKYGSRVKGDLALFSCGLGFPHPKTGKPMTFATKPQGHPGTLSKEILMTFDELYQIQNEAERVNRTYDIFNEDARLRSPAARVEFLTNSRYIQQALKPGARVLDIGAGAGEYSLHFARMGYQVSALELADANIRAFRSKLCSEDPIELVQGNALDLSRWPDNSFDAVLVFGPLYHLQDPADRQKCIWEAKRVCRPDGTLFFAFISHDMVFFTELGYDKDYFKTGDYDHETFRLHDFPFVFHTVPECRAMLTEAGLTVCNEVASDGLSELMAQRINSLDEESYARYLELHFRLCEKPELLGHSNHLLFICKK